jgi:hypothetical protein
MDILLNNNNLHNYIKHNYTIPLIIIYCYLFYRFIFIIYILNKIFIFFINFINS